MCQKIHKFKFNICCTCRILHIE